jgi:hypothetical protein
VEAFNQVMNLPLHQDLDAMNACSKLEDPTQGGPRRGLVALIRSRFMAIGSWLTQAALRQRIHQQRQRHDQQYSPESDGGF